MKRFLILLSFLFCNVVFADTINLHWLNEDGTTYQNSTCEIDSDLILPATPPTKYGYTFTGWNMVNYIPIEYLESTGTQWIDTGTISQNLTFLVELKVKDRKGGVFGYSYSDNGVVHRMGLYFNNSGNGDAVLGQGDGASGFTIFDGLPTNVKSSVYVKFGSNLVTLKVNGNTLVTKSGFSRNSPTNSFIIGVNGSPVRGFIGNTYSVKIYDDKDVLIHDFIPVLDYTNTPCMYDKVTKQFFYNQGSGDFIAGPVVNE